MLTPTEGKPTKTFTCSGLLWLRKDSDRDDALAYWIGPHSQLVVGTPGCSEYRQHHLKADSRGDWPTLDDVETAIPLERRIDGMAEVTFEHPWSLLLGGRQSKKVKEDERNVFARTVLQLTGFRGGRWFRSGYDTEVGARAIILLRRREAVSRRRFKAFVADTLGPALARAEGTAEFRTHSFLPFSHRLWNTPGVAHDYPTNARFHASLVLGAADEAALAQVMASVAAELSDELRESCAAIHAYEVDQTYLLVRDGRPALPQERPERKAETRSRHP